MEWCEHELIDHEFDRIVKINSNSSISTFMIHIRFGIGRSMRSTSFLIVDRVCEKIESRRFHEFSSRHSLFEWMCSTLWKKQTYTHTHVECAEWIERTISPVDQTRRKMRSKRVLKHLKFHMPPVVDSNCIWTSETIEMNRMSFLRYARLWFKFFFALSPVMTAYIPFPTGHSIIRCPYGCCCLSVLFIIDDVYIVLVKNRTIFTHHQLLFITILIPFRLLISCLLYSIRAQLIS